MRRKPRLFRVDNVLYPVRVMRCAECGRLSHDSAFRDGTLCTPCVKDTDIPF